MITLKRITSQNADTDMIESLYNRAFPKEEKAPFYFLKLGCEWEQVEFLSAYDKDTWVGAIYAIHGENLTYVFYYMIEENVRSHGYGSEVLQAFLKGRDRVILAIEPVDESATNYNERKRRFSFYERNGFSSLGYTVEEMGVIFEVLSYQGLIVEKNEYIALLKKLFKHVENSKDKMLTVSQMQAADAYTIAHVTTGKELMKRAGEAIYYAHDWHRHVNGVLIVCGTGNNAGDGYVLARYLAMEGTPCTLFLVSDKFSKDGRYYYERCKACDIPSVEMAEFLTVDGSVDRENLQVFLGKFDCLVDCIYGTGFRGEVKELVNSLIEAMNASLAYVVSIDINSGMDGDTGEATVCVVSDLTISIGYMKQGLMCPEAKKYIKKVVNREIGIVLG